MSHTATLRAAEHNPNAYSHPVSWAPAAVKGRFGVDIPQIKNHTATLVGSKVWVFGGYDSKANHATIHVLDCTTYEWERLRNIKPHIDEKTGEKRFPEGRNGHTCTFADGQLWIIGGWLGHGPLAASDMWVFDITLSQWIEPETYGEKPGACNMHTTEYIKHLGELFVFRGGDGRMYMNDLHSFNIRKMYWKPINTAGRRPVKRANHASCVVDSKLFIFGGWDGGKRLNDIHILDTKHNPPLWSKPETRGEPPSPRAGMTLTNVNGKIFLFGGSGPQNKCYDDLQVYDPKTNTWLTTARVEESHRLITGGTVQGGDEDINKDREELKSRHEKQKLEPQTEVQGAYGEGNPNAEPSGADITVLHKGPCERAGHTATLIGRKLLIFGGSQNVRPNYFNDFFELDTDPPPVVVVNSLTSVQLFQNSLSTFMNTEKFSDVTFIVEGRPVYAHRMVLCLMSERFRGMFSSGFRETNEREIIIEGVSYDAFMLMLEYLYTGVPPDFVLATGQPFKRMLAGKETAGIYEVSRKEEEGNDEDNGDSEEEEDVDDEESELDSDLSDYDGAWELGESIDTGLNNNTQLVDAQRGGLADMKIIDNRIALIIELMQVSDQYMLDHLKQACEKSLEKVVTFETVDALYNEAERCNALQLKAICVHFKRNYHLNESILPADF